MTPIEKLRHLLEGHGIYRRVIKLMRDHVNESTREHRRLSEVSMQKSIVNNPGSWELPDELKDRQRRFASPLPQVTPSIGAGDPVSDLADRTQDAYSYNRYGEQEWQACIAMLLKRGYSETDVEHILRSKWMRWVGDAGKNPDAPTTQDLEQFLDNPRNRAGPNFLYSISP